jgi:NodT family efflux transporter outer membrane factor (OMF) lipoprotein
MRIHFPANRCGLSGLALCALVGCVAPRLAPAPAVGPVPTSFAGAAVRARGAESASSGDIAWRTFFEDSTLRALIDTAVRNNAELLSTLQEVEMARYEVQSVRGRLAPQVSIAAGLGVDKSARYTSEGAGNASTDITDGKRVPEPLTDINVGFVAAWEADVRGKIRSRKGAALSRYLATVEGSRYVMTSLVAEVTNGYYELTALDAKLAIVRQTIALQQKSLALVRAQREAAAANELAVQRFSALLLSAQGLEYELLQQITEVENRLNLLLGRYPQAVARGSALPTSAPRALGAGLPSQLLQNRPDIRAAEWELKAAHFDVKAARAEFFPEINLTGGLGLRAFKPSLLFTLPESMAYMLAGDVMAPLFNRTAITAEYGRASAAQQQALIAYRRTIVGGVTEVSTLMSALENLERVSRFKSQQADALDRSVEVAGQLFNAARANYLEVLTVQREALDVKLELVETRLRQRVALTNLYRALGGGWK